MDQMKSGWRGRKKQKDRKFGKKTLQKKIELGFFLVADEHYKPSFLKENF